MLGIGSQTDVRGTTYYINNGKVDAVSIPYLGNRFDIPYQKLQGILINFGARVALGYSISFEKFEDAKKALDWLQSLELMEKLIN